MAINFKKLSKKFSGKKVLVTGHTGFKGSWLVLILKFLGAKVIGVSDKLVSSPSHFQLIKKHNNKNTIQKTSRATTLYLDMLYIELIVLHRRIFLGRRGSIQWTRILWRIDR